MSFAQEKQHTGEFLEWLVGPAYWLTESQLSTFRQERSEGTLAWARNMPEFQLWRLSDLSDESERRITWIKGPLGLGKSIIAAYLIDLLKCQYQNAVVAYFFCRKGQAGLTSARDILRTLACQCIGKNKAAQEALEKLKSRGFQITPDIGIGYLFEKLLLDALSSTQEVYIVLDGLDEADDVTPDHTDPAGRPELHVFLACLAKVSSVRLLCISRPTALQSVIPNTFEKTISKSDNAEDIDSYVREMLKDFQNLRHLFEEAGEDPINYFRTTGDGVFLWVKLVLRQLMKAKTVFTFQKYLDRFSAASESTSESTEKLHKLYCAILSVIDEDYKVWVREIMCWTLIAKGPLSLSTLQGLAEWCLRPDKTTDFHRFLDETCGALLQYLPHPDGKGMRVELVHETFKSFIGHSKTCPTEFRVDTREIECHAAFKSLECLSNHSSAPEQVGKYCSAHWVEHLSKSTATEWCSRLLVALHGFFVSTSGTRFWVKRLCSENQGGYYPYLRSVDDALRDLNGWLRLDHETDTATAHPLGLEKSLSWRNIVLGQPTLLGEIMGKSAVSIWLHERLDHDVVLNCFNLGLKYYWRRANRSLSNLEELDELVATDFRNLSVWADPSVPVVAKVHGNLSLAFYAVFEFDKCLQYIRDNSVLDTDDQLLWCVASCLSAKCDYDGVISVWEKRGDVSLTLAKAYEITGDCNTATDVFRTAYERDPSSRISWQSLIRAYWNRGDYDKIIEMSLPVLENYQLESGWKMLPYYYLYHACVKKGDLGEAIRVCEIRTDENPKDFLPWSYLARSYNARGDYDSALRTLERGLLENPRDWRLSSRLADMVIKTANPADAIQILRTAIDKDQIDILEALRRLEPVYKLRGDSVGWIAELKRIVRTRPSNCRTLHLLSEACIEAGEYEDAITTVARAMEKTELGSYELDSLSRDLYKAYRASGDHTRALEVFESKAKSNVNAARSGQFWVSTLLDLYDAKNDSAGAIEMFEGIVSATDNGGEWGWPGLLRSSARKADFDATLLRFEIVVDENIVELSPPMAMELLNAFSAIGAQDKAIGMLTKIVHRLPRESWPWHLLGEAHIRMGNRTEAIKVYESALRRLRCDYTFYLRLSNVYLAACEYERVVECYERAKEIIGPSWVYWQGEDWWLAAYRGMPWTDWEWQCLGIVIDETFCEHFTWYPICQAYRRLGDDCRAHEIYNSVLRTYTDQDVDRFGFYYAMYDGRLDVSARDGVSVSQAWTRLPEYGRLCAMAEVYRAMEDVKSALEAFKNAREFLPSNLFLDDVIKELEWQIGDGK
jgi:tetratricopeptide (TPR) repeat protein